MFFPFVLFASLVICYIQRQHTHSTGEKFPDDIQHWCPHTKFCDLAHTNPLSSSVKKEANDFKPCCEQCLCTPDCGRKRNCCFEKHDEYKLDTTHGTVCKPLNNKLYDNRDRNHYHMVNKCPNKDDTCRMKSGSVWGPFFPVYSRSNNMIYYNKYCADCDNQTDIVAFKPSFSCSFLDRPLSEMITSAVDETKGDCYIQFFAPNKVDISGEACYPHIIRDCVGSKDNHPEFRNLCRSFNATFHNRVFTYQNVYCYLCVANDISDKQWKNMNIMCPARGNERNDDHTALIVLLDRDSVDIYENSQTNTPEDTCVHLKYGNSSMSKMCRLVHCPEGQVLLNRNCKLLGYQWYLQNVQIYVKLTPIDPDKELTLSIIHNVSSDELKSPRKEFIWRPELQDWDMDLFYSVKENGTTVHYIIAVMYLKKKNIKPELFLDRIRFALREGWSLFVKGESFKLSAEFNKHVYYEGFGGVFIPSHGKTSGPYTDKIMAWSSHGLFTTKHLEFRLIITKLFYCKQVDLYAGEFRIDRVGVFIHSTHKYLGNADFKVSEGFSFTPEKIRVCLSDVLIVKNNADQSEGHIIILFLICCELILKALSI